ncbi:hypothetical protein [Gracilimonas sp. BCB1]|uniref:hypothetical protein n=1 Tax=Gracilimonas sp. BCB1 TaxID=3152362 RepID=UPI0032D91680
MKHSKATNRFFLLLLPFLFTGCYTQFQTFDQYPLENDRYSDYYSWSGFEKGTTADTDDSGTSYYNSDEEEYLDEQLALEEDGIYYIDYETEQWYKAHFAEKMFWKGYSAGYNDGFYDGSFHYPYNSWFSYNRYGYGYGYGYYDYYYPRFRSSIWIGFGGFHHPRFYAGYYGHWGYYGPYYDGYWGHPYYSYVRVYNNYHRSNKYSRSADLYYKGPRGSGFANGSDYRTRSGNGVTRTRNSGLTRTRGTNNGVRVRSTGSSTKRGSSVGRSSGTRTRGSSVGKSRSGSKNNGRSRGSGSSVGRDRGSKGNSSSGTRKRSRGNDSASLSSTSVRTIDISDFNGRSYTIPARKVRVNGLNRSSSRSGLKNIGSFLDRSIFKSTSSSFDFNSRSRLNTSKTKNNFSRGVTRKSSGTKVTRSSSSSRSSGTRSKGSSSSSKKRSRGGN